MKFIPRPLVTPGPNSQQVGHALAKLIATARKNPTNQTK